jgi:hypothetical protein
MKTRTMYLHTLDGQPASYDDRNGAYLYFVGGRNKAKLARSLRQIEREQQNARLAAWQDPSQHEWTEHKRYGYVLVEVPC